MPDVRTLGFTGLDVHQINGETAKDDARWYAINTHPRQEDRANENLRARKVETFSPKVKKILRNPYARVPVYVSRPLFSRYIFARFDANTGLRKILEDGFVEVGEKLKKGDRVMIDVGPLKSLVGIFKRDVKGSDRVLILLTAISFQSSAIIEKDHVRKVGSL